MNCSNCRTLGSYWAIAQGLLTALVPQLSIALIKKTIGKNFQNAGELEAKPEYLRQLRALGIGLAAAGIAGLAMERVADDADADDGIDSAGDIGNDTDNGGGDGLDDTDDAETGDR